MKPFLFSLLLLSFWNAKSIAQPIPDTHPWCPPGATWVYRSFSATSQLNYKFAYEKDTVIASVPVKTWVVYRIEYIGIGPNPLRIEDRVGQEYLYASNDSVYWYDPINLEFDFIYDFSPNVGDGWLLSNSRAVCLNLPNYPLSDTVFVNAQVVDTIGNRIFDTYYTSYDRLYSIGTVVRNIGPLVSPFPEINSPQQQCTWRYAEYGDWYDWLVCYSDSLRGYMQFNSSGWDCHTLTTSVEKVAATSQSPFVLYPNPGTHTVQISTEGLRIQELTVYHASGQLVLRIQPQSVNPSFEVADWSAGLYFVRLLDEKNQVTVLKMSKE